MGCGVSRLEPDDLLDTLTGAAAKTGLPDEAKRKKWLPIAPRESTASVTALALASEAEGEEGVGGRGGEDGGSGMAEKKANWHSRQDMDLKGEAADQNEEDKGEAGKTTLVVQVKEGSLMDSDKGRRLMDDVDDNGERPGSPSFRVYVDDDAQATHSVDSPKSTAGQCLLSNKDACVNTEEGPSKTAARTPRHHFRGRRLRALAKKPGASMYALFRPRHSSSNSMASTGSCSDVSNGNQDQPSRRSCTLPPKASFPPL